MICVASSLSDGISETYSRLLVIGRGFELR
jgi:hypothetical protein